MRMYLVPGSVACLYSDDTLVLLMIPATVVLCWLRCRAMEMFVGSLVV